MAVRQGDNVDIGVLPVDFGIGDLNKVGDGLLAKLAMRPGLDDFEAGMGYASYETGEFTPVSGIHTVTNGLIACRDLPQMHPGVPLA